MTQTSQKRTSWSRNLGPGLLVTAAFIGPGTVAKATSAGAGYGHALLWAIVFSVFATIVFQEMAARVGVVSQNGLGDALRRTLSNSLLRNLSIGLVVAAILVGNAAYQAGNIAGAATGLSLLTGELHSAIYPIVIGVIAFGVLMIGRYKTLQNVLIALVVFMSCVFIVTAIVVGPNWASVLRSMFAPRIPSGSLSEVIALIGTTVVPYNLFLHASSAAAQWSSKIDSDSVEVRDALRTSRIDTTLSVGLGGFVTLAIMVTASAAFFQTGSDYNGLSDAARQLEPMVGSYAKWLFCGGLFAAGLTSAITAPLAASYAAAGCFGWKADLKDRKFRIVFTLVIVCGTFFAALGRKPTEIITIAQIANGLLLPLIAIFLLAVMNNSKLLGEHRNGITANLLGAFVVLVITGLGVRSLFLTISALAP